MLILMFILSLILSLGPWLSFPLVNVVVDIDVDALLDLVSVAFCTTYITLRDYESILFFMEGEGENLSPIISTSFLLFRGETFFFVRGLYVVGFLCGIFFSFRFIFFLLVGFSFPLV